MNELSLDVDSEVEKVYTKLLRKELEHPEKWELFDNWNYHYSSPMINDDKFFFVTLGTNSNYDGAFYVYEHISGGGRNKIHEIKLRFWDFKTPRMLRRFHRFMPHKKKWLESQNTTKTLKELLGVEFDRYAKIMKIKKKL